MLDYCITQIAANTLYDCELADEKDPEQKKFASMFAECFHVDERVKM